MGYASVLPHAYRRLPHAYASAAPYLPHTWFPRGYASGVRSHILDTATRCALLRALVLDFSRRRWRLCCEGLLPSYPCLYYAHDARRRSRCALLRADLSSVRLCCIEYISTTPRPPSPARVVRRLLSLLLSYFSRARGDRIERLPSSPASEWGFRLQADRTCLVCARIRTGLLSPGASSSSAAGGSAAAWSPGRSARCAV